MIYVLFLLIMLYTLYRAGLVIRDSGKLFPPVGLTAIIVYTLNEGLRFGRGIDYNLYGMSYEELEKTGESNWDVSFQFIAKTLITFDIPWQGYVMFMSLIFIIATILLLRVYKDVLPFALPLFVLFSLPETENMVRWYSGFSFIMIGLYYLLCEERRSYLKYWGFSAFACTFHFALLPLPFVFYLLHTIKKPILSPIWVLLIYFTIAFTFQTEYMIQFVDIANLLSSTLGGDSGAVSSRIESYGDRGEYWLTGGFAGTENHSALPDVQELFFLCFVLWLGYKFLRSADRKYVFAYNMFVFGLLFNPLARQIELIVRYNQPFMFFRAIVVACIIEYIYISKIVRVPQIVWLIALLVFLNVGRRTIMGPFKGNPEHYLYVWDQGERTYQSMYDMWIDDMLESDAKKQKKNND